MRDKRIELERVARNRLHACLMDAYDLASFRQMVLFELGKRLGDIVDERQAFEYVVSDLIEWAQRHHQERKLIEGAYRTVPTNGMLAEFAEECGIALPSQQKDGEGFTDAYKRALIRKLDRMELFGLRGRDESIIPISVAYISLVAREGWWDGRYEQGDGDGMMLREGGRFNRHDPQPIETILAQLAQNEKKRMFISGKTTLLKRIAVMMAANELPDELSHLRGVTPFYVRLRDYVDSGDTKKPIRTALHDLVKQYEMVTPDRVPDGWVTEQVTRGRIALLVDGFDEVNQAKREEVRDWLEGMLGEAETALFVLSGRPEAIEPGSQFGRWLQGHAFTHVELRPMDTAQIETFVTHWHNALATATTLPPESKSRLPTQSAALIAVLKNRQYDHLQTLAETPLLCALICALHQRGWDVANVRLPDLFREAMEMFLSRRDADRAVDWSPYLPLPSLEEWKRVLQEIAFWMLDVNGNTTIEKMDLRQLLDQNVTLRHAGCDVEKLLRYLVERASLFSPVDGETLEFVHRSFLEYLAAQWIVYKSMAKVPWLIQHFTQEHWHGALKMVAYLGNESEQLALMEALNDEAASWLTMVESKRVTEEDMQYARHRRGLELFYCIRCPSEQLWEWHQLHINSVIRTYGTYRGYESLDLSTLPLSTVEWMTSTLRLETVTALNLGGTAITDVTPLQNLAQLKRLWLHETAVTDEQVAALLVALPNLKITR